MSPCLILSGAATGYVTVTSNRREVTQWLRAYFGSWWYAKEEKQQRGPLVQADVNPDDLDDLTQQACTRPVATAMYGGVPMTYRHASNGDVLAAQVNRHLAYRYTPGGALRIVGADPFHVELAAARLARERARAQLYASGWSLLRASAVATQDGKAVLALGPKGVGKSTTAVHLVHAGRGDLVSVGKVFVKPGPYGVSVLSWPSAAAIGFGLLDACGLYDTVAWKVKTGTNLFPTTDAYVIDALLHKRRTPVRDARGRELKPHFHPRQLGDLLVLPTKGGGIAGRLLYPTLEPAFQPTVADGGRPVGYDDFVTTDDPHYPDVFGLLPQGTEGPEWMALRALNAVPRNTLSLGHDADVNKDLLRKITA
ncbi:hypothetical protein [Streptomyces sp. NPDC059003]|uniref:hypothetical protein n=1 Tax=Streptomyces sp. NPDC059003 TaxID=3346691 RepID=UPI00368ADB98